MILVHFFLHRLVKNRSSELTLITRVNKKAPRVRKQNRRGFSYTRKIANLAGHWLGVAVFTVSSFLAKSSRVPLRG
jgi:hypothetical protein